MGFQQFRRFFRAVLLRRVTVTYEPPEVPLLHPAMYLFLYSTTAVDNTIHHLSNCFNLLHFKLPEHAHVSGDSFFGDTFGYYKVSAFVGYFVTHPMSIPGVVNA